jgi:hypothetical protein
MQPAMQPLDLQAGYDLWELYEYRVLCGRNLRGSRNLFGSRIVAQHQIQMEMCSLEGKLLAVLVMGQTSDGQDDWAVFTGTARVSEDLLFLDRHGKPSFEIRAEWLDRIKSVGSKVKDILLGAEFYLPLTIGPLPEGQSAESYIATGLKWPE